MLDHQALSERGRGTTSVLRKFAARGDFTNEATIS